MHRSRLSILLLDLPPDQHAAGRDFWSAATGRPAAPDPTDDRWASLGSFADGFHLAVQRTGEGTPPRWHVGIQTARSSTGTPPPGPEPEARSAVGAPVVPG